MGWVSTLATAPVLGLSLRQLFESIEATGALEALAVCACGVSSMQWMPSLGLCTVSIPTSRAKKEWTIEHKLETRLVHVAVQTSEAEEPAELESPSNYKVKAVSAKSVEVTFTVAPAAGKLLYITVIG